MIGAVKHALQLGIRQVHMRWLDRGLPDRLGLYFHSLPPESHYAFGALVDALRARGYRFVTTSAFRATGAGRVAALSFDDNYRAWYASLPLFARLDVPATFYVNSLPLREDAHDVPADVAARESAYFDRHNEIYFVSPVCDLHS